MNSKLTKEQAEKKAKYHKKRMNYYNNKVEEIEKDNSRIGFKFYK